MHQANKAMSSTAVRDVTSVAHCLLWSNFEHIEPRTHRQYATRDGHNLPESRTAVLWKPTVLEGSLKFTSDKQSQRILLMHVDKQIEQRHSAKSPCGICKAAA